VNNRPTTIMIARQNGATHFLAIVIALVMFGLASFILIANVRALTTVHMGFALLLIGAAIGIAIPAEARMARRFLAKCAGTIVGGRRWYDPRSDVDTRPR
jgi:hypothetical protein